MIAFFSVSVGEIPLVDVDQPLYDEFASSEKLPFISSYNAMTATSDVVLAEITGKLCSTFLEV